MRDFYFGKVHRFQEKEQEQKEEQEQKQEEEQEQEQEQKEEQEQKQEQAGMVSGRQTERRAPYSLSLSLFASCIAPSE